MKISFKLILVVGLLFLITSFLSAEDYRETASKSSIDLYHQMFVYAEKQDNDKILTLLDSIKVPLNGIKSNFGKDLNAMIKQALSTGSKEDVLQALYTLIYYEMKNVFRDTVKGIESGRLPPLATLKERLKLAYVDYLLVSPKAREKNFDLDREIRKDFNKLFTGDLAKAVSEDNKNILQNAFNSIENKYKDIFKL